MHPQLPSNLLIGSCLIASVFLLPPTDAFAAAPLLRIRAFQASTSPLALRPGLRRSLLEGLRASDDGKGDADSGTTRPQDVFFRQAAAAAAQAAAGAKAGTKTAEEEKKASGAGVQSKKQVLAVGTSMTAEEILAQTEEGEAEEEKAQVAKVRAEAETAAAAKAAKAAKAATEAKAKEEEVAAVKAKEAKAKQVKEEKEKAAAAAAATAKAEEENAAPAAKVVAKAKEEKAAAAAKAGKAEKEMAARKKKEEAVAVFPSEGKRKVTWKSEDVGEADVRMGSTLPCYAFGVPCPVLTYVMTLPDKGSVVSGGFAVVVAVTCVVGTLGAIASGREANDVFSSLLATAIALLLVQLTPKDKQ